MSFSSNTSSGYSIEPQRAPGEMFNIISLQSSARPGCIIELEPLADAKQVSGERCRWTQKSIGPKY